MPRITKSYVTGKLYNSTTNGQIGGSGRLELPNGLADNVISNAMVQMSQYFWGSGLQKRPHYASICAAKVKPECYLQLLRKKWAEN